MAKKAKPLSRATLERRLRTANAENECLRARRDTLIRHRDESYSEYEKQKQARAELAKQLTKAHDDLEAAQADGLRRQVELYEPLFRDAGITLETHEWPMVRWYIGTGERMVMTRMHFTEILWRGVRPIYVGLRLAWEPVEDRIAKGA